MNWLLKVAAFKLLSSVPKGAALYRYSQERITGSLVPTRARVGAKVDVSLQYWDWLQANHWTAGAAPQSHVDFGCGWHPTVPLMFYALGMERQYLFDVTPVLSRDLISQTVNTVLSIIDDPQWPHRARLRRLPKIYSDTQLPWAEYLRQMGITYHAPYESAFKEISGTLDVGTSTQALLHIPRDILLNCFRELYQSLKKGGKFLATIHLHDLHANAQNGLSPYNHLRYSPEAWETWINSPMMSYNRLKAADYRDLLERAGFQLRYFDVTPPTAADLAELARIPIHQSFSRYSREELAARHLFFAAEKA